MQHVVGWVVAAVLLASAAPAAVTVERFTPLGEAKQVRQATAVFSEPMVQFGDLRAVMPPFAVDCPVPGSGRWVDPRTWVYDFERELPGGIRCTFRGRTDLRSQAGHPVTSTLWFEFTTGGPAVLRSLPMDGSDEVDEQQAFVLVLDGEATPDSVLAHAGVEVDGIAERIGVSLVEGEERDALVAALPYWLKPEPPFVVVRARQTLPNATPVRLVWGAGITSPAGVATRTPQILEYTTRPRFAAEVSCERESATAGCTPLTPITVRFTAPVAWTQAQQVRLIGPDDQAHAPETPDEPVESVTRLSFAPPFPPDATLRLAVPADLRDDAGRALSAGADAVVRTAAYPPLAKFAARFGLLEAHADPALPITIRNLDPEVGGTEVRTTRPRPSGWRATVQDLYAQLGGATTRVERAEDVLPWLRRLATARRDRSMFADLPAGVTPRRFTLPQPEGPETMQVVGLPFDAPGLYLVELTSPRLGAALLGDDQLFYVPAGALVTNLAVHFKWARENALVWVTTLDDATPVEGARITVQDCTGAVLATALSDGDGLARISGLPAPDRAANCYDSSRFEGFTGHDYRDYSSAPALTDLDDGLLILAETTRDLSFVHSSWQRGIEPWRFNLPSAPWDGPVVAHTIFDRTLFRRGETVHMKHVLRAQTLAGFAAVPDAERPVKAIVRHLGSNESYDLPLTWGANELAEQEWTIPAAAKLGQYEVALARADGRERQGGTFRVEQFRVPLMRATVQLPAEPLIGAQTAPVDVAVQYLAGGPAAELPVVLRAQLRDRPLPVDESLETFTFAAGPVRAGLTREDQSQMQEPAGAAQSPVLSRQELTLDAAGTARAHVTGLPAVETPRELLAEIEYRDPNGEVQTAAARVPLWPAAVVPGIRAEHWTGGEDELTVQVAAIDPRGKPAANVPVEITAYRRLYYANRKRLVGGFYGYEHVVETRELQRLCTGRTDTKGRFDCRVPPPARGALIVEARLVDGDGRTAMTHADVYVDAPDPLGFPVEASDRMDVLPESRDYAPGDTAQLQVRMPFRAATALVTVEREGIADAHVVALDGGAPRVSVPIAGSYAPNVFVSVLAVRGRVAGTQPTALVDLGKPAFRLGVTELRVGWRAHELDVRVRADRDTYRVRDTAHVTIAVRTADGTPPPAGSEVAVAAVDEGLLELQPNDSWALLNAMMGRRGYDVRTATAQLEVIGKRHYGRKVLPVGGGGGRQATRELFDTLLLWAGRVPLDADGTARVDVPLGDALSAFRIVAVATAGLDRFGTGSTEVRTTQELMLLSGLPPVVRQGDRFPAQFTLRNTTDRPLEVSATLQVAAGDAALPLDGDTQTVALAAGEAHVLAWPITAPADGERLVYTVAARAGDFTDRLRVTQELRPAVPTRTLQSVLLRADQPLRLPVALPADALPERGGLDVSATASLGGVTAGLEEYLRTYPYTCLEQQVSVAVGLADAARWQAISAALPSYVDDDGLLKYFPTLGTGSEVLTAYVLAVSQAAGLALPPMVQERMVNGLRAFVAGRISRESLLRAPDLTVRKLAAIAALARVGAFEASMLDGLTIEPALWPTSALLDWWDIVQRMPASPQRDARLAEVEQQLRTRLDLQGTMLRFRSERSDNLWWLMASPDVNAVRLLLHVAEFGVWRDDAARVARGALARQQRGHWSTTTANAWGAVALRRFASAFESEPVTGTTDVALGDVHETLTWTTPPAPVHLAWPAAPAELAITQQGTGAPWVTVASRAAIPLREPISAGYRIAKTVTPIEPREPGRLSRGDRLHVRLEIEATADMTWVVVDDPIPAGASHLGTGLARDRQITDSASADDAVTPDFVERRFDAWRGYFQFLPGGRTVVEYEIRLNQSGDFSLPPTRVEALYAPEMFAELPNAPVEVAE